MLELSAVEWQAGGFALSASLRLERGMSGFVVGPSASGKTSLLRLIAGFAKPVRGQISLGGRRIDGLPPEGRGVGLVFQGDSLFPTMSVRANLEFGPRIAGMDRSARVRLVEGLAESMGLTGLLDRGTRHLSGGERQRVALARSLATKPELLLLDEPLASLDPGSRAALGSEIEVRTRALGLTSLRVTHDLAEALAGADRIFLMEKGTIIDSGSPLGLYENPANSRTVRFLGSGICIPIREKDRGGWQTQLGRLPPECQASTIIPRAGEELVAFFPAREAQLHGDRAIQDPAMFSTRALVRSLVFRGMRNEAVLDLGVDSGPLCLEVSSLVMLQKGESVGLSWPLASIRIISR
ncbi:MAG: ABC transporter ATP-binding protein [Spirochaetota bacterium]